MSVKLWQTHLYSVFKETKPNILEMKSERSSRAKNIPQLGSSPVSDCRKPGLRTFQIFKHFAQPQEQSPPRLEAVIKRQKIEGDDKI